MTNSITTNDEVHVIEMAWNFINFTNLNVKLSGYGDLCWTCGTDGKLREIQLTTISPNECRNFSARFSIKHDLCHIRNIDW